MGRTTSKIQMATHILPKNRRKGKKRRRRQHPPKENELEPCPVDAPASPGRGDGHGALAGHRLLPHGDWVGTTRHSTAHSPTVLPSSTTHSPKKHGAAKGWAQRGSTQANASLLF